MMVLFLLYQGGGLEEICKHYLLTEWLRPVQLTALPAQYAGWLVPFFSSAGIGHGFFTPQRPVEYLY